MNDHLCHSPALFAEVRNQFLWFKFQQLLILTISTGQKIEAPLIYCQSPERYFRDLSLNLLDYAPY